VSEFFYDLGRLLARLARDPAPCGHCGATDHDTAHCPGQGG
jgi:hypothetical protein